MEYYDPSNKYYHYRIDGSNNNGSNKRIGDRGNPLTAEIIQRKWNQDKEKAQQWDEGRRQIRRKNDREELRKKFRGLDKAIKKRFEELKVDLEKELGGSGRVKQEKRGNGKYFYRFVNRKSEYLAKDWSDCLNKLWVKARKQVFVERGLNDMYEGLALAEIEVLDAIMNDWLMVRKRVQRRRSVQRRFKEAGLGTKVSPVKIVGYDKEVHHYAEILNLEHHQSTRHFSIKNMDIPELKKLLKSARRVLAKYQCCSFAAKARVKCTQNGEQENSYIPLVTQRQELI
ncbi:MAG: hypothetical protein WBQ25_22760 [Nitrososphaeraceae archaeon]